MAHSTPPKSLSGSPTPPSRRIRSCIAQVETPGSPGSIEVHFVTRLRSLYLMAPRLGSSVRSITNRHVRCSPQCLTSKSGQLWAVEMDLPPRDSRPPTWRPLPRLRIPLCVSSACGLVQLWEPNMHPKFAILRNSMISLKSGGAWL
jgi:hypothetical protein